MSTWRISLIINGCSLNWYQTWNYYLVVCFTKWHCLHENKVAKLARMNCAGSAIFCHVLKNNIRKTNNLRLVKWVQIHTILELLFYNSIISDYIIKLTVFIRIRWINKLPKLAWRSRNKGVILWLETLISFLWIKLQLACLLKWRRSMISILTDLFAKLRGLI